MAKHLKINKAIFNENHWPTNDRDSGIIIASERFSGMVKYVIKQESLIILSGNNGILCFDLDVGDDFVNEVSAIVDCYKK